MKALRPPFQRGECRGDNVVTMLIVGRAYGPRRLDVSTTISWVKNLIWRRIYDRLLIYLRSLASLFGQLANARPHLLLTIYLTGRRRARQSSVMKTETGVGDLNTRKYSRSPILWRQGEGICRGRWSKLRLTMLSWADISLWAQLHVYVETVEIVGQTFHDANHTKMRGSWLCMWHFFVHVIKWFEIKKNTWLIDNYKLHVDSSRIRRNQNPNKI